MEGDIEQIYFGSQDDVLEVGVVREIGYDGRSD